MEELVQCSGCNVEIPEGETVSPDSDPFEVMCPECYREYLDDQWERREMEADYWRTTV